MKENYPSQPTKKLKELFKIISLAILLTLITLSLQKTFRFQRSDLPQDTQLRTIAPFPLLEAQNLQGAPVFFKPQKPSLIIFWAQWCAYCLDELPKLKEIKKKYSNLKIIAINLDEAQETDKARAYWEKQNFSYTSFFSITQKFQEQISIQALPSHMFINKEGQIVLKIKGIVDWSGPKVNSLIEELLH